MGRIACLVLCLALAPLVHAGGKGRLGLLEIFCPGRLRPTTCCPDDYCSKPPVCLPPAYCPCGCDDYCAKPPPWLSPEYCPCGCDDYCAKPMPALDCVAGKCYPTDGCCPREKCWWLCDKWWGKRLCPPGCCTKGQ